MCKARPNQAPLQVAQICGHWRAIALATPELWSSVLLEFRENNYSGDDIYDFFNLWLTRAGDYPLSITILCRERSVGVPQKLLEAMATHCTCKPVCSLSPSQKMKRAWAYFSASNQSECVVSIPQLFQGNLMGRDQDRGESLAVILIFNHKKIMPQIRGLLSGWFVLLKCAVSV
jgi:hypothetical protein